MTFDSESLKSRTLLFLAELEEHRRKLETELTDLNRLQAEAELSRFSYDLSAIRGLSLEHDRLTALHEQIAELEIDCRELTRRLEQ